MLVSRYVPCCALLCSKNPSAVSFICRRCARRYPVPFRERPGGVQHQTRRSRLEASLLQQGGQPNFAERVLLLRVVQSFVMAMHEAVALRPLLGTSGFLPSIALIAPRTPTRPRLKVAMERGVRPRTRRVSRSAPWRLSLHRMMLRMRACNEAQSAQLFLLLSDIAWYIAGAAAGCYIPPFISGVLYN